jgi:hypothetical protein
MNSELESMWNEAALDTSRIARKLELKSAVGKSAVEEGLL